MPTIFPDGPYLTAAVLCERVLQERDGVLSFIRVVDKMTQATIAPADQLPPEMPAMPINLTLVVCLKGGQALGRYSLKVQAEEPSGIKKEPHQLPVNFTGQASGGTNLVIGFNMVAQLEGVYWIDISLDDNLLTRLPLQVEYQPHQMPPGGPPAQ